MNPQELNAQAAKKPTNRRGVVIVAVLLVVTLLSLAAYQYSDLMLAEATVTDNVHRAAQTRAFAESGIYYTMALLSNQQNFTTVLNGNPYNNPQLFQNIAVQGDNGLSGRFSIIAPPDPTTGIGAGNINVPTYGVTDECGKINLVSWMNIDPTGGQLLNLLSYLPNMTPQIAANIIAWMGGQAGVNAGGVQDEVYMSLTPPYRCKNNVPDSLDELLLVQGVTRDLLYGADVNRNGVEDGSEQATTSSTIPPNSGFDRGWSAFLTIHSREQNNDANGNPYVYLNNTDLQQLYNAISVEVDDDLAKFIIMYRQYGLASSSGGSQGLASTLKSMLGGSSGSTSTPQGTLSSYQLQYNKSGGTQFKSFFQLVNASVSVPVTNAAGKSVTTSFASPLNDVGSQRALLPALFSVATLCPNPEIPARININTAPFEVLTGLQSLSGLADTDVQNIIQMRQQATGQVGDIYATPTWLLTEANISPQVLQQLDSVGASGGGSSSSSGGSGCITTRSQVYRVQSVGYFDGGKGPAVRIEAVIDSGLPSNSTATTSTARPRIIAWRNLSELGKGWTDPSGQNGPPATSNP